MADQSKLDDVTPAERARMDIIGLKICIQALLLHSIKSTSQKEVINEAKAIYDLIIPAVDTIVFSDPSTAELWREGVRESVKDVFNPFLGIRK